MLKGLGDLAGSYPQGSAAARAVLDVKRPTLGHVGISDLITLMGFYTSVSMSLAFYDVPADAPGMAR